MCVEGGQSCGTVPLTYSIWYHLQVWRVRIELVSQTIAWCGEKPPHTWWLEVSEVFYLYNKGGPPPPPPLPGRKKWGFSLHRRKILRFPFREPEKLGQNFRADWRLTQGNRIFLQAWPDWHLEAAVNLVSRYVLRIWVACVVHSQVGGWERESQSDWNFEKESWMYCQSLRVALAKEKLAWRSCVCVRVYLNEYTNDQVIESHKWVNNWCNKIWGSWYVNTGMHMGDEGEENRR